MALSLRFHLAVIALTLVHLFIDFCKIRLSKTRPAADGAPAFLVDQFAHVITVVLAACWIERTPLASVARGQPAFASGTEQSTFASVGRLHCCDLRLRLFDPLRH